ncbi:membrane-spanning 4-domains subfamily A member 3-like [Manis javanica]|uniref:membrane-spanning 4-domains subfamily A member 3-like n=1 Tax=Manis javanica TaxID=9974 RepID=UPI003C6D7F19
MNPDYGGPRKTIETYYSFICFIFYFQQFIFTGSSSIEAGRIPERLLVEVKIGRYLISAVITLVGVVLLSVNLFLTNEWLKNCPLSGSPELCRYMGTSNNGLLSLMLIFTLLEFCVTISTATTWLAPTLLHRVFWLRQARIFRGII